MLNIYSVIYVKLLGLAFPEMFLINDVFKACSQHVYWEIAFLKAVGMNAPWPG